MGWQNFVFELLVAGHTVRIDSSGLFIYNGAPVGQVTSTGSVAAPAIHSTITQVTAIAPGTFTVNWDVTLAGTLGAGDVNNFNLLHNGVLVTASVNTATVATFPQAAVSLSLAVGDTLTIQSGSNAGTAGSTYGGTVTIVGTLIASVTNASSDFYGNPTRPIFAVYGATDDYVRLGTGPGGRAQIDLAIGHPDESVPAHIASQLVGTGGGTRQIQTLLTTGKFAGPGLSTFCVLSETGGSADGTINGVIAGNVFPNGGGGSGFQINDYTYSMTSTNAAATLTSQLLMTPSNLTLTQTGNNWGVDHTISSVNVITRTNPVAAIAITDAFNIPAGEVTIVGSEYIIEVPFRGVWEASGALNLAYGLSGTITNLTPVAATLAAAGHNYGGTFRLYLRVTALGAGGTCDIWSGGDATDTSVVRAGATSASLFGITTGIAFNTTVSNTFEVAAFFSVSNASQTIIGQGSTFTRKGR